MDDDNDDEDDCFQEPSACGAERKQIRSLLEQDASAMADLKATGAYFNARDVLEFTCTRKTLKALDNVVPRLKWLYRPPGLERQSVVGQDKKGLDELKVTADGTQSAETGFGEIEKPSACAAANSTSACGRA